MHSGIRIRIFPACLVAVGLTVGCGSQAAAQEMREWQDRDGKYSVEARLLEQSDAEVLLVTSDGREIRVPIERLSQQDRQYLTEIAQAAAIGITPGWSIPVDEQGFAPPREPRVVALPERNSITETFSITAVAPQVDRALVSSVYSNRRQGRKQFSRLQLLDYGKGDLVYEGDVEGPWKPLALNADATHVALQYIPQRGDDPIRQGEIVIVQLKEESPDVVSQSRPFADIENPTDEELIEQLKARESEMSHSEKSRLQSVVDGRSEHSRQTALSYFRPPNGHLVSFASFLGDEQLVVVNALGVVRWLNWKTWTCDREIEFPTPCSAVTSPNGRLLAMANGTSVAVVNLEDPDVFAMKSFAGRPGSVRLAFSPSGKRLLVSPVNQLFVLDVATGETLHAGSLNFAGANRTIAFASEEMILVDHAYLYDFQNQTFAWVYPGAHCRMAGATALWTAERKPQHVVIDSLPGREVVSRLTEFVESPDFQIIRPGFEVQLDLMDVAEPWRERVKQSITKVVETSGGKVVRQSPVILKCFVNSPEVRRLSYMMTGTHDIPVIVCGASLVVDGNERWRFAWDNVPESIEGGSRAETTRNLIERCKNPDLSLFGWAELLPKKLQRNPEGPPVTDKLNAFGRSRLTERGWEVEE